MTLTADGENSSLSSRSSRRLGVLGRVFCGLRMYQRPLGARGMLAYCSYRLFGSPDTLTVTSPGIRNPVTLRMRTTDTSIYEDIVLRGHYALPLPFVPETIVDLGANIGMASVYYANQFPKARIIAVEAEASNFGILQRNVTNYPTILPIHAAIWNKDGQIGLGTPRGTDGAIDKIVFAVREHEGTPVRAIAMQTLMNEAQISSIDILKVDIEGAEKEVFETAPDWIQNVRCLAIELHDRFKPGCRQAVSAVTGDFLESQRGETTFFVHKSCLTAAG
jgi:FkbM family methyltransferase